MSQADSLSTLENKDDDIAKLLEKEFKELLQRFKDNLAEPNT